MKTITCLACAVLLGVMILFTMGTAQLSGVWDGTAKAANLAGIRAADRITPNPMHDLVLALHAAGPADLASPPSALDGAPALPAPPR